MRLLRFIQIYKKKKKKEQSWCIVVDGRAWHGMGWRCGSMVGVSVRVGRKDLESRHVTTKVHRSWVGRLQRALTLPSASQP